MKPNDEDIERQKAIKFFSQEVERLLSPIGILNDKVGKDFRFSSEKVDWERKLMYVKNYPHNVVLELQNKNMAEEIHSFQMTEIVD